MKGRVLGRVEFAIMGASASKPFLHEALEDAKVSLGNSPVCERATAIFSGSSSAAGRNGQGGSWRRRLGEWCGRNGRSAQNEAKGGGEDGTKRSEHGARRWWWWV